MRSPSSRLRVISVAAAVLALVSLAAGCGEDSTTNPPPVNEFAPPSDLTVVNGSNSVILSWRASTDAGDSDFRGYNVYRHTATMVGATDAQLRGYLRNSGTNAYITGRTWTDAGAVNGTRYYYAVRAVRGDGELSEPTNEYDTAPRHEGAAAVTLAEFRYAGQPSGLNCSTPRAYAMESSAPNDNRLLIDCYLGTLGVNDETSQVLALKSPHRVLNGSASWSARVAELVQLGTGQAGWDIPAAPTTGWSASVELGADPVDKVIAVRTPADANGKRHYAKIWIAGVEGAAGQRRISVLVAWQEIADYPRFVAPR
jgi:hypothetical protein